MAEKNHQVVAPPRVMRWWVVCGVFLGLVIAVALNVWPSAVPEIHYDPVRLKAWDKVTPRLKEADEGEGKIIERQLDAIREFFDERKGRVTAFAESALSLGGKWAWLKGAVTFDDGAGHRDYLREKFEEHVFRGEELRAVIAGVIISTLSELKALENDLLIQIRVDLADSELMLEHNLPALQNDQVFFRAFENAAKEVISVMAREMGITVGREVVTWVAADIATQVIARVGISAGILGAGAASGVATLGIGVAAALVVDMVVDWGLKRMGHDPIGEVSRKVSESLDRTRSFIVDGAPGGQPGLRQELRKLCESQSRVRREALRKLILLEGGLQ